MSHVTEEARLDSGSEVVSDDIHKGHEGPAETQEASIDMEKEHSQPHITVTEDGGRFNKNKDNQPSFGAAEEMQRGPQDTLESPLDVGLGIKVEHSHSGW